MDRSGFASRAALRQFLSRGSLITECLLICSLLTCMTLSGCAESLSSPVFVWVVQTGPLELSLDRVSVSDSGPGTGRGVIRALWEFLPPDKAIEERLGLSARTGYIEFTLIAAAPGIPNWSGFEVRYDTLLVNHLVRPEEDYLKTGGNAEMVSLGRSLLSKQAGLGAAPARSLSLYFITFSYPSEFGVRREPGRVSIRHRLGPVASSGFSASYLMGLSTEAAPAHAPALAARSDTLSRALEISSVVSPDAVKIVVGSSPQRFIYPVFLASVLSVVLALTRHIRRKTR